MPFDSWIDAIRSFLYNGNILDLKEAICHVDDDRICVFLFELVRGEASPEFQKKGFSLFHLLTSEEKYIEAAIIKIATLMPFASHIERAHTLPHDRERKQRVPAVWDLFERKKYEASQYGILDDLRVICIQALARQVDSNMARFGSWVVNFGKLEEMRG